MISLDTMTDEEILRALLGKLSQGHQERRRLEAYYEGAPRLKAMGLSLPPEMQALSLVVNWSGQYVDALEERLDVDGFRLAGASQTDETLWDWWQTNNLDEESGLGHLEAMVTGRSVVTVGSSEDDGAPPVIRVEPSGAMELAVDPKTRETLAAVRDYSRDGRTDRKATLYLPDRTVHYEQVKGQWNVLETDEHSLGVVAAVQLTNRARLGARCGVTEMRDVMGLTDAACRSLTNLQGAQELLAVPQRVVLGATEADFQDQDGNRVPAWEAYLGRFLALGDKDAKVTQFNAADLRNFTEVINQYARLVSSVTGLPPHYLGFTSDNPASADAIRSSEARLIKRAERRARSFGGSWEQVMRLAMLIDGRDPGAAVRLETVWRDPSTPTLAARADAVVKLYQAGILPLEAAWEQMGYTPEYRRHLRQLSSNDPAARFLEATNGGTQPAPGAAP
ncbi:phage portal protein [Kitasatospora indigofera]|uniref:phage portal protein n=1 Tax=Kitasatospora indigofera TaxID=67307 RepID=UPI0036852C54